MADISPLCRRIMDNVEKVIVGKRDVIRMMLVSILCEGHVLFEDVPGVAKTMLARSMSKSIGLSFARVQGTPDLLPSDITGVSVFNQKTTEFEFVKGPVFNHIVLADEINRATPRAQAALLEAMAERQVTVDGTTYTLNAPFIVMATQNPIEHEGTFPLPEAQLDRFLMKLSVGYPSFSDENTMLERLRLHHPIEDAEQVTDASEMIAANRVVRDVYVHEKVREYIVRVVHATRRSTDLSMGGSPRASIALYRTAQALAAIEGRTYVIPDDVKDVAQPVLAHRVIVNPESRLRGKKGDEVIQGVIDAVPAPVEKETK